MNKLIENFGKKEAVSILVCLAYLLQGIATLIYQVSWEQAMENYCWHGFTYYIHCNEHIFF